MIKTYNKNFKERIQKYLGGQHFMKLMNFELTVIEAGRTEGWLTISSDHKQQKGLLHGGVTATVADIVAGFAAYTLVPEDYHVVTAELKVSYLNPGLGDQLHAIGTVLKQGKKMNFCEAEVYTVTGEKRTLIAKATTTMAVISPEDLQ